MKPEKPKKFKLNKSEFFKSDFSHITKDWDDDIKESIVDVEVIVSKGVIVLSVDTVPKNHGNPNKLPNNNNESESNKELQLIGI